VGGRPRSEAALSGILRCGDCGEAMMTECATGRAGKRYHYYNCRSFLKGMGCATKRIPVSDLDSQVVNTILTRVFTPENLRGLVVEMRQQSSSFERERQDRIDALGKESADVERRLTRLYESIEGGAGLELADVAPRIRSLRERQKALSADAERVLGERGPMADVTDADMWRAADLFKEMVRDCEDPARIRQFLTMIIKQASIKGDQIAIEYWPERIVSTVGDSQCSVRWLLDLGSNQGPTD
jgi:site-specific DNA recombinase